MSKNRCFTGSPVFKRVIFCKHRRKTLESNILYWLYLFFKKKNTEIKVVYPLADCIQVGCGLCGLHFTFKTRYILLPADKSTIIDCLIKVNTNTILIFSQSFYIVSLLSEHCLQRVRERHYIALIGSLSYCRNLRKPSF